MVTMEAESLGGALQTGEHSRPCFGPGWRQSPARVPVVTDGTDATLRLPPPRMLRWEIFVVFGLSLGASGLNAALSLVGSLLSRQSLSSQQALLVGPLAINSWLDLVLQLVGIAEALMPVVLVLYLMARSGESPSVIGLDATEPTRDFVRGAILAAVICGAGLGPSLSPLPPGPSVKL